MFYVNVKDFGRSYHELTFNEKFHLWNLPLKESLEIDEDAVRRFHISVPVDGKGWVYPVFVTDNLKLAMDRSILDDVIDLRMLLKRRRHFVKMF